MAPNGPIKFCAGRFGGEIWLNGTHEGRSLGAYEISARKSSVPEPSRRSAKTSFHAVFLVVRATAAHSNARESPFNFIPSNAPEKRERKTSNVQRRMLRARLSGVGTPGFLGSSLDIGRWNVKRWTFSFSRRFPPCAAQPSALTLRRVMRFLLRRAGLALAAGFTIFCCSCERHRIGELPAEHETKSTGIEAAKPHVAPSPDARMSPANFFPDKPRP